MLRKTRPFSELRQEQLLIPEVASEYLNLAKAQSQEIFLKALRRVAQARQMSKVAKEAGVQRESLYRALSEIGNPNFDTLLSVLSVLGLDFEISPKKKGDSRSIVPNPACEPLDSLPKKQELIAPIIGIEPPTFTVNSGFGWDSTSSTFNFLSTPRSVGTWAILKQPELPVSVYEDKRESLVA
jgi:probable addiction module antidote protein